MWFSIRSIAVDIHASVKLPVNAFYVPMFTNIECREVKVFGTEFPVYTHIIFPQLTR